VEVDYLPISGFGTEWVEPLRAKLGALSEKSDSHRLWLVADEANGAVGLVNCLRLEEGGNKIR